jgi:RND family efflux transporter MFP subunit
MLAALLAGLAACREESEATVAEPVRPVLSVVVQERTGETFGPFAGTIEPRYRTDLGFRILGRMVARFVDVGSVVRQGQELAALDPADAVQGVRGAEAALSGAEAQLANANAEEVRQRDLVLRNVTPQAQYDVVARNRETAAANVTSARARLGKAQDRLSFTQLKADYGGVITGRYAEPGQVVNAGQRIVTLARPEIREAVIAVPIELADMLSARNDLEMTVYLDETVSMKAAGVRAVDPAADATTRTRVVYLSLHDPPAAFRLGITISVLMRRAVPPRVDLPATALLDRDGKSLVWVVDPGSSVVSTREVAVASRNGDSVGLNGGLRSGERVVVVGVHSLTPGQVVKLAP